MRRRSSTSNGIEKRSIVQVWGAVFVAELKGPEEAGEHLPNGD
jgi:hypothetical protein